jgi:hypothetical protein
MLAPYGPPDNAMSDPPTARPTLARAIARWIHGADAAALDAGVRRRMRAALAGLLGDARAAEIEREIDAITASPDAGRLARLLGHD